MADGEDRAGAEAPQPKRRSEKSPWADERRPRDKSFGEKQDAVLQAAARLFCEKGYERGSFDELAARLNVTKPTIYYHVGSKEECFYEITRRGQAPILDSLAKVDDLPGNSLDKLIHLLRVYTNTITTDLGRCLIMVGRSPLTGRRRSEIEDRISAANKVWMGLIEAGMREGLIKRHDPSVAFNSIFGAINWTVTWFKPGKRLSVEQLVDAEINFLLEGIRAPKAG